MEKIVETKKCNKCSVSFDITDRDIEFYEKISPSFSWKKFSISSPTFCPDCRAQRRLSYLNQRSLYKNKCNLCNNQIVSRFHENCNINNYCNECWSSDKWDQLELWLDIDLNKSFFEQFIYLINNTNYQNLIWSSSNVKNNSVYTNHTSEIHDSYLVFEANKISKSIYSFWIKNCLSAVDCSFVWNSEYVYECVDSYDMYNCFYCMNSFWCKFSYFLDNCQNCEYCVWCTNLVGKKYYILNKEVTKEEYKNVISELNNLSNISNYKYKFEKLYKNKVCKSWNLVWSEKSSWNNIISSNNCTESFDILWCNDCKYCSNVNYSNDLFDISSYWEESSRMYESVSVGRYSNNIFFSSIVWKWNNLYYCIDVKQSNNCFLCVNMQNKSYCILNKQYTKQEYEKLVPKIIEKMIEDWEWWEFFPASISPFWYNETVANEYYPLKKEEAIKAWFNWSDYEAPKPNVEKIIPASKLPENIEDIPDDILNRAIECEVTKKPFRIIKQELEFYRKHNLPIPRRHPDQRHLDRMALRNPRKLYDRKCDKCTKDIKTTYAPDRPEIVYCVSCYNNEIY